MRFVTLVKFTGQGVTHIGQTTDRAKAFLETAQAAGIQVREMLWTQGQYDGVLLFDAADVETAAAVTLRLASKGNVQSETLVAFDADGMDRVLAKLTD